MWVLAALFEAMISLALLMTAFGDTPSLARVTANGENMLRHLAQPDQPISQVDVDSIGPVLAATSEAFRQLGNLLSWLGVVLLICVVVQCAALIMLSRRKT
jgi:hypothetical protein